MNIKISNKIFVKDNDLLDMCINNNLKYVKKNNILSKKIAFYRYLNAFYRIKTLVLTIIYIFTMFCLLLNRKNSITPIHLWIK